MNITLEYLQQEGMLLKSKLILLHDEEDRGVHIGMFGKQHFANVREFAEMVGRISAITQEWYAHGRLEEAFKSYEPGDGQQAGRQMMSRATRIKGSLRDWIIEHGVEIDADEIPPEISGRLHYEGDADEFLMIADCPEFYAEIYIADCVA